MASDIYTKYEQALDFLKGKIGAIEVEFSGKFYTLESRLRSVINKMRLHPVTSSDKSELSQTIEQLNPLSLEVLGTSFNDLVYKKTAVSPTHKKPPKQQLISRLTNLLQGLRWPDENVRILLQSCLPAPLQHITFDPLHFPTLSDILEELWETKDEKGHYACFWHLVQITQEKRDIPKKIKQAFLTWYKEYEASTDLLLPDQPIETPLGKETVLFIEIESAPDKEQYLISAWRCQWQEGKPTTPERIYGSETIRFETAILQTHIARIIETGEQRGKIDRIEVFLPIHKLFFPIDQLTHQVLDELEDEEPLERKWAHHYEIVVRSQERALGRWRRKKPIQDSWKEKWKRIQTKPDSQMVKLHDETITAQQLFSLLDGNEEIGCGCVMFPYKGVDKHKRKLVSNLIRNGLPVIWGFHEEAHQNCTPESIVQQICGELEDLFQELEWFLLANIWYHERAKLHLMELPHRIFMIRRSTKARLMQEYIGNRWALLWDDYETAQLLQQQKG